MPAFKQDVAIVSPDTGSTEIWSEVREEVRQSGSESFVCINDWLNRILLVGAVSSANNELVIFTEETSKVRIIKIIECSAYVCPGIDECLTFVERF